MLTIREEILVFLTAIIAGMIVRLIYKCISVLRRILPHKLWLINVEDIGFWTGTAVYLFVQIYHTSDGSIRWYFVLGVVVGVALSSLFLRKLEKVTKKIYTSKSEKNFENVAKKSKKRYDNRY